MTVFSSSRWIQACISCNSNSNIWTILVKIQNPSIKPTPTNTCRNWLSEEFAKKVKFLKNTLWRNDYLDVRISGAVCEGVSFCKCKCDKKSGRNIFLQDWDQTLVSDVSGMLSPFQGHNNNTLPKTMQPILPGDFLPPRIQRKKQQSFNPTNTREEPGQPIPPKLPLLNSKFSTKECRQQCKVHCNFPQIAHTSSCQ